jgi:hypothetical protein
MVFLNACPPAEQAELFNSIIVILGFPVKRTEILIEAYAQPETYPEQANEGVYGEPRAQIKFTLKIENMHDRGGKAQGKHQA